MMRLLVLTLLVTAASGQYGSANKKQTCSKVCKSLETCEVQTCEVCVPVELTCENTVCLSTQKCVDTPDGPKCVPKTCQDITCPKTHKCQDTPDGGVCVPLTCADITCSRRKKCEETENGPVCVPKTCDDIECKETHKCFINPRGYPQCKPKTCADIRCAAGEICTDLPDGPDCVPDVPSCKDFYCRRGTNCYIRQGTPICLPNTCQVRNCTLGLSCIDTPSGALCLRGDNSRSCERKYCPKNTMCIVSEPLGAHCVII